MQNSTNMRILELLQFLYERTDENHPATVSDIIAHLNGKGIQAVRQTVYADTNALIDAGIDIVVVKSTQNQYFMGSRPFEYPELKMLTDAVASSKIISARKSEELVQKRHLRQLPGNLLREKQVPEDFVPSWSIP